MIVINVTGGRFEGEGLNGSVVGPSGDWIRLQENGNWKIDARLALKSDDGDTLFCYYGGVVGMTEALEARAAAGEIIPGSDLYLRAAPNFETSSNKYGWLNDILAIGKVTRFGGGNLNYDIFQVL